MMVTALLLRLLLSAPLRDEPEPEPLAFVVDVSGWGHDDGVFASEGADIYKGTDAMVVRP